MIHRTLVLLLSFALLATAAEAAPRRRAVRTPEPRCNYALTIDFADPIDDGGLQRGVVHVTPLGDHCPGWIAESPVQWITIETDPDTANDAAYVTVSPNPSTEPRAALISVARVQVQITQLGQDVVVSPPSAGLLVNGNFHFDLAEWGWQDRFPNGSGDATWSSLDANGSMTSGSMRLTDDTSTAPAFQRMQCVNTTPGNFDYGFTVRSASRDGAQGVMSFVRFLGTNCTGNYTRDAPKIVRVTETGVWETHTYTDILPLGYQSIGLIVAGYAVQPGTQQVWVDDVFLRPR
jgi:hypothetical protein